MDGFPCFLTLAFTDADVDFVISKFKKVYQNFAEIGFIPSDKNNDHSQITSNGHLQMVMDNIPMPGARLGKRCQWKRCLVYCRPRKTG